MNITMYYKNLSELSRGQTARIAKLEAAPAVRQRLLDLGLVEHTQIEHLQTAPGGDPAAYLVRGTVVALRREDADRIRVYQSK